MEVIQLELDNMLKNFHYIIKLDDSRAWVIDPFDTRVINDEIKRQQLNVVGIVNTHSHFDHIAGNDALVDKYNCELITPKDSYIPNATREVEHEEVIDLGGNVELKAISTPGHMNVHFSYVIIDNGVEVGILGGDSVFNCGIGNCRDGSVDSTFDTITNTYLEFNPSLLLYVGHNYFHTNLQFSQYVEPENEFRDSILQQIESGEYNNMTIEDEKKMNPFFRLNSKILRERVESITNETLSNEKEVFKALRRLRDNW